MTSTVALLPLQRTISLDAAADQLIKSRRSVNTQDAYRLDWRHWCEYAARNGIDPTQPTLIDTINFRDELKHRYGSTSVARKLATLTFFYRAFMAAGLVRVNPFDRAWLPRDEVAVGKTAAIDVSDAQQILAVTAGDRSSVGKRDLAVLQLLYDTGARRASIRGALRTHIDFTTNTLRIVVKGNKEKLLPFTMDCVVALRDWLTVAPVSNYLFPSSHAGIDKPVNLATINRIVTERAAQAGMEGIHPHRFRAAFITDAYSAGIPERDIQTAAHHADAAMTRRYDRGVRGEHVADRVAAFRKTKG